MAMADIQQMRIDAPVDPDAQATVTDFLDYTEHLPSDAVRSLTLIRKQDETYLCRVDSIHKLLETYAFTKTTPRQLEQIRKQVSVELDYALGAREAAAAEAARMYNEIDRNHNRLASVATKLQALPKPPSREPTPIPHALPPSSPQTARRQSNRYEESITSPPARITLRMGAASATANNHRSTTNGHRKRHRPHRITVPGEVLPPPNPNSPLFTDSESEPPLPSSPIPVPTARVGSTFVRRESTSKPNRSSTPKPPKPPKPPKIKVPKIPKEPKTPRPPRPPRPPGTMGTNVHSQVAGISTSNALSLLTPPPADAKPGSTHAPWMRLTEWEMAKLRKRMKKNAIWTPSETMIRRELSDAGRGPENYRKTKTQADDAGEVFLDCDDIAHTAPGKPLVPGEISADVLGLEDKLSNKGMKLNEAKKLKREAQAKEMAANAAAEKAAEASGGGGTGAAHRVGGANANGVPVNIAPKPASLPNKPPSVEEPPKRGTFSKDPEKEKANPKKRKQDAVVASATVPDDAAPGPSDTSQKPLPKKRKLLPAPPLLPPPTAPSSTSTTTQTTQIPLAPAAPSPPKKAPTPPPPTTTRKPAPVHHPVPLPTPSATSNRPRRVSVQQGTKPVAPPSPPKVPSRPPSRRASATPARELPLREQSRRKSSTPAMSTGTAAAAAPVVTAASRRSKRPAPGPVTSSTDGGAALSVGPRKNAPRKRGGAAGARKGEEDGGGGGKVGGGHGKRADAAGAGGEEGGKDKAGGGKKEKEKGTGKGVEKDAGGGGEEAEDMEVDPDEPRYCVCEDVSYGLMIQCEASDCEKEWFHLECVGLEEPPARRAKWYCPDCKVRLGK